MIVRFYRPFLHQPVGMLCLRWWVVTLCEGNGDWRKFGSGGTKTAYTISMKDMAVMQSWALWPL